MIKEPPQNAVETVEELSGLNVVQDVCHGQRSGVEENIKTGITNDLLESLGWDRRTQMDFEHNVGPKSADIALIKNRDSNVIVETKSLEKRLEKHKSQGLEYARRQGILWVVMTNGLRTQLYKSTVPQVSDKDNEPIFESSLQELPEKFSRLYQLIGEPNIDQIEEQTSDDIEYLKKKISEKEFLDQLLESKRELYYDLRNEFDKRYGPDDEFTNHIDEWVETQDYDDSWDWRTRFRKDNAFADYIQQIVSDTSLKSTKTALAGSGGKYRQDEEYKQAVNRVLRDHSIPVDWKDKLCNQGAYSFVNRVIFLRMYEDRVEGAKRKLDENWLNLVDNEDSEGTIRLLNHAFSDIRDEFSGIYDKPLFDDLHLDQLNWDSGIVYDIVERTQEHDFSSVDADILGEVYQNHIPKEVRKALGQFYTSPSIVRYMIDRVNPHIDSQSKVIDPACGSGTFLTELYNELKDDLVKEGWGEGAAHQHLLSKVLFGVDIDNFATQLTTMNLLLRDMNHPENTDNIITGNSVAPLTENLGALTANQSPAKQLKGESDEGDDDDPGVEQSMYGLLKDATGDNGEGFQVVIGNPPYFHAPKNDRMALDGTKYERAIELEYEDVVSGKANIASFFIKRGLEILDPEDGVLGLVLPKPLLYAHGYRDLRKYIRDNCRIKEVTDLGKAWDEVGYEQCIMFLEPEENEEERHDNTVRVVSGIRDADYLEYGEFTEHYIEQKKFYDYDAFPIYLTTALTPEIEEVWQKMRDESLLFKDINADVFRGLGIQGEDKHLADSKQDPDWTPMLRGRNLGGDKDSTGQSWYIDLEDVDWVNTSSQDLTGKTERLEKDKIICKRLVSSDVKIDATYDDSASTEEIPYYNYDTITNIVIDDARFIDLYILGVLTSKPITTYLRDLVFARATLTMDLDEPYLSPLPIPDIPKETGNGSVSQEDIANTVQTLLDTKQELEQREYTIESASGDYLDIQNKFNEARRRLNQQVGNAFDLTEKELRTLESVYEGQV